MKTSRLILIPAVLFMISFSVKLTAQQKSTQITPSEREEGIIVMEERTENAPVAGEDNMIYTSVEMQPEFPGGMKAFYQYISKNFKLPAGVALNGNIFATFIVEKNGSISDIKVIRDLGYDTGKEAERLLKESPRWKPGIQNGRAVRTRFSLPIKVVSSGEAPKDKK